MTIYWRQGGTVLRDDGQEEWCVFNPALGDWERTPRAKSAYRFAGQDPFTEITEHSANEFIEYRKKRWAKVLEASKNEKANVTDKQEPENGDKAWTGNNF